MAPIDHHWYIINMITDNLTWDLPLKSCPMIAQMNGRSQHGHRGIEHYRLNQIWCLNLYEGTGQLRIAGHVLPIRPGYASITVPDHDMDYRFDGPATLTWAHFIPVRGAGTQPIPAMLDLAGDFDRIRLSIQHAAAVLAEKPERAAARVWEVLWEITELGDVSAPPHAALHPALSLVFGQIHARLAEPLSIEDLAKSADISQTHLNRLFRQAAGQTVSEYIRTRRLDRARHLLRYSTLPIKSIAAEVGIPDPHLFNKTVRKAFGGPPTAFRKTR